MEGASVGGGGGIRPSPGENPIISFTPNVICKAVNTKNVSSWVIGKMWV